MTLRRLLIISDGLVNSDRDYGGYYRGDEVDAAIRRLDDVIAEMANRIAELEAEKETREYVGPIELAPHVWAESDEAIAKLEAERRS